MIKRRSVCLFACAALAATPAPAQAARRPTGRTVLVASNGKPMPGPYRAWVRQSKVPTVRGRVKVILSGCPGRPRLTGCVYSKRPKRLYLRRGTTQARAILYHELGYLFDLRVMNRRDRRDFKRLIGKPTSAWYRGTNPPSEQFAEAYALCARRKTVRRRTRVYYAYSATPREHRAACAIMRRTLRPNAPPPAPPRKPATGVRAAVPTGAPAIRAAGRRVAARPDHRPAARLSRTRLPDSTAWTSRCSKAPSKSSVSPRSAAARCGSGPPAAPAPTAR